MHHTTNEQLPRSVVLGATTVEAAGNILEVAAQPTGNNLNPFLLNGGNLFSLTIDATNTVGNVTVTIFVQATPGGAWALDMTYVHGAGTTVKTDRTLNGWAVRVTLLAVAPPSTLDSVEMRAARAGA